MRLYDYTPSGFINLKKFLLSFVFCLYIFIFNGIQLLFLKEHFNSILIFPLIIFEVMLTKKNKEPKTFTNAGITGKYLKKEAPSDVPSKKQIKIQISFHC